MQLLNFRFGDFVITNNPAEMDVEAIHDYLTNHSGWSNNIPIERVQISMENSLNFGLLHLGKQIGFARVISDFSTIAYLGDVYILEHYQGQGLSKKLMDAVMTHPDLQGLRRWILLTSTADWLYAKYGFKKVPNPEIYMELYNPAVYKK